ncbi:MAG: ABC transporter permease, partial [Actinomycetota bacterium]|nr:ABC transporter permease [Actinomycetota bacterium]
MNPGALPPLAAMVALAVLPVAVMALVRPVLRRLAVRSAARRPGETTLVILGSLLGTAIITGSFIVGDTLDNSIRAGAWTQLGPIDETVTAFGVEALPLLQEALGGLPEHPDVDGVAFALRASAIAAARLEADDRAAQPNVTLLETDFDQGRRFGADRTATGLGETSTPGQGEVALSEDLAAQLEVGEGDEVTLFAYGAEERLEVSAVLPRLGLAGFTTAQTSQSFNAFVPPGTIARLASQAPPDLSAAPPVSLALVSNRGGVIEGADLTDQVVELVARRISKVQGAEVDPTKQQVLETAEEVGGEFSSLFLSIGAFAVIAGVLLVVNIFVMLAEERKGELGMMRAIGMRRGQLVRSFTIEGTLYALVASLVGALLGIGVGAAIVRVASDIFQRGDDFSLELRNTVTWASVAGGFAIGLLISLATVLATSFRIGQINIIRAIRDLPEPVSRRPPLWSLALGALLAAAGSAWLPAAISAGDPYGVLAGPGLLALGLAPLSARLLPRRLVVTILGVALVIWGIYADTFFPQVFQNADTPVFVLQGVLLTFAAVAVASQNQELVAALVRRVAGGAGPRGRVWVRLGVAYPLARRLRTGMTLGMYALVVFTLTFISILSNIFARQVDRFTEDESGGYHLLVRSSPAAPIPVELLEDAPGVEHAAPLRYAAFSVEFRSEGREEFDFWALSGFGASFLDARPPDLGEWLPEYPDQRSVWQAVLRDPRLVIIDAFFLQTGAGPAVDKVEVGDRVQVRDPLTGRVLARRVVAQT